MEWHDLSRTTMDNVVFKIDGYDMRTKNETPEDSFKRAKAELIANLQKEIDQVKCVPFEVYEFQRG